MEISRAQKVKSTNWTECYSSPLLCLLKQSSLPARLILKLAYGCDFTGTNSLNLGFLFLNKQTSTHQITKPSWTYHEQYIGLLMPPATTELESNACARTLDWTHHGAMMVCTVQKSDRSLFTDGAWGHGRPAPNATFSPSTKHGGMVGMMTKLMIYRSRTNKSFYLPINWTATSKSWSPYIIYD